MDKTYPSSSHSLWYRQECWVSGRSNRCGEVERKDIIIVGLKGNTQEIAGGPWEVDREQNGKRKYVRASTLITVHGHTFDSRATHLPPCPDTSSLIQHLPILPIISKNRTHVRPLANASPKSCSLVVSIGVFQTQGHDSLMGWEVRSQPIFFKQNIIY